MWEYIIIQIMLLGMALVFWERREELQGYVALFASLALGYLVARAAAGANDAVAMYAAAIIAFTGVLLFMAHIASKVAGVRL